MLVLYISVNACFFCGVPGVVVSFGYTSWWLWWGVMCGFCSTVGSRRLV